MIDAFEEKRGGRWRLTLAFPYVDGGTLCDVVESARTAGTVLNREVLGG